MSTYVLLVLLLMSLSSGMCDDPDCPLLRNCLCTVPRALRCTGRDQRFYQETIEALAALPPGTVQLLEIHLEDASQLDPLDSTALVVDLPRLVLSSNNGLKAVTARSLDAVTRRLQHLSLAENQLQAVPSVALRNASNLRTLDFQQNKISQLFVGDLKNLTNLTHLDISHNLLTRVAVGTFAGLYNLQELMLSNNSLTNDALVTLADLPNLRELDLSSNRLEGNVDEELMPNLPNLETLSMQHNNLLSIRSGSLAGCPQLHTLNLSHNAIEVLEDGAFLLLSELLTLDLSHNEIISVSRWSLRGLTELRALRLSGNHLQAISVDLVTHIRAARDLWLDGNDIAKVERGVADVLRAGCLTGLRLDDNPFECDCSIREFAIWLRNSSLADEDDRLSAVCATPVAMVGAHLAAAALDEFKCFAEQEGWKTETKKFNLVLPTVPGLPATTGSIRLHEYKYTPETGVVLTWSIAPGPSFACDAVFIYEADQTGTGNEVLLESNPVRCSKEYEDPKDSDGSWRRVSLAVPGSLDLLDRGWYRYCLVLTRSAAGVSDDVNFALGCSDFIQLYKNGDQMRAPDPSIKFVSTAVNGDGELRLHVFVHTSEPVAVTADEQTCSLGVAVLAQGSVIARRDAPCNVLVRLQGFLEGPYTVCVALSGHIVPGPHAKCASVVRSVQASNFQPSRAGTLVVFGIIGCLLVLSIAVIMALMIIKILKRHRQSCNTYYVKLHNTTTVL